VRLFAALVPPPGAIEHLQSAVTRLRDDALRWTDVPDWHVTLAFYGELAEPKLPDLTERLTRAAARHDPMELALTGAGRFGKQALWVGVAGQTAALRRIAASANAAGRRAGAVEDDRRFRPHVTLARGYRNRPADLRQYVAELVGYEGSVWTAREIRLIQSHLGAGRPRYETLATCALARTD
jgi:2'-5' RNA ligase